MTTEVRHAYATVRVSRELVEKENETFRKLVREQLVETLTDFGRPVDVRFWIGPLERHGIYYALPSTRDQYTVMATAKIAAR